MYFDDYVDEMVEDDDEDESSVESDASSDGDLGSFHKKTNPERVFVRNLPSAGATGMPQKLNDSIESEEEKHEDGGDVKLQAGVIDYCIVLGKCRKSDNADFFHFMFIKLIGILPLLSHM